MKTLANYAIPANYTAGRINGNLEADPFPYLTDRNRIIQSMSFRRLEYKTQVFVNHAGDHFRTRLTHSLEVAQVAITICRLLSLNEDLAENISLCHDIGHPPFGHAGEDGLNEAAAKYGGFNHNFQTVKVLTVLEQKYPEFEGLNLTYETLEGVIKHNGPILIDTSKLPKFIQDLLIKFDFLITKQSSLEAQVAGLADDIAYCSHDIDDGIRAGIFKLDDLKEISIIKNIIGEIKNAYPNATLSKIINKTVRTIAKRMIEDLVKTTQTNIAKYNILNLDDVRNHSSALVCFSKETENMKIALKAFLMKNVYRNYIVNRMSEKGKAINKKIFNFYMQKPECLPTEWQTKISLNNSNSKAETIIDFISGMTDRYAAEEFKKLFDPNYF